MQFSQQRPWFALCVNSSLAFAAGAAVPASAQVQATGEPAAAKGWRAETVTDALPQPWAMAWLPDGRMLVTGKEQAVPLEGLPALMTSGQGGLLDIAVHPADKGPAVRVYMTMANGSSSDNRTILVQGGFDGKKVSGIKTLFRASPSKSGGALPEIWSWGHRNVQGLTVDAASGRVYAREHGPRGGDEINRIEGGKNYGWPIQSFGADYNTREPVGKPSVPGMVDPLVAWAPSPAPSGLALYTGSTFPQWRGSLFSGSLAAMDVRRIELDKDGKVVRQERLNIGKRVRDVRQGPDGHLYVLTDEDDGRILRIVPDKS